LNLPVSSWDMSECLSYSYTALRRFWTPSIVLMTLSVTFLASTYEFCSACVPVKGTDLSHDSIP
jgi:hypothetical protein